MRKDFVDYEEFDLMMAAELKSCYDIAYLIYKITERRAVDKRKNLTPNGRLKTVFSGRQKGFCSRKDACSFPHTHATGDREDNVG